MSQDTPTYQEIVKLQRLLRKGSDTDIWEHYEEIVKAIDLLVKLLDQ